MKSVQTIAAGLLLLFTFAGSAQENSYQAGFKIISTYDSGRFYKPQATRSDKLYYRPVNIDVWYPARTTPSDTVASFADLVYLLEQRSNFYDDTRNYDGLTEELLQYICAGLNCVSPDTLRKVKTTSYVNAKRVEQKFPLIIYFAAFNGMSYENYALFESLAKNGFVVASVSSIGRYPGNMTMEPEDIAEQIKDAAFTIDHLTKNNLASGNIGFVGYSWGGLAAAIMAMHESHNIRAIVSLDGSEQFTYADDIETEKLNRIRHAEFFKPEAIRSPFLYLDSDITTWDNLPDSIYNITDHIPGDTDYVKINQATHEDFSSLAMLIPENKNAARHQLIQQLTLNYLRDKLKGEIVFTEHLPTEGISKQFSQPVAKVSAETSDKKTVKGIIRDKKTNLPLPYVNIGIPGKDVGTTSNAKGEFELLLLESNENDTLKISRVGYASTVVALKDVFIKQKVSLNIQLQEAINTLGEIVITEKKLTTKILGNKTDSKFIGGKFASGDLGSEIAIRVKIKNSPTWLDTFSFNISHNSGDTATFRVNVYEVSDGLPSKNILQENVMVTINGQTGKINIDLSPYNIVTENDFFIGLEWIDGRSNSGIVFSAGFVNKGTYYRKASQGHWKKYPMGVGFNVTAKY